MVLLEARTAQYRPALSWFERNGGFDSAFRAGCPGFRPRPGAPANAFGLAALAALGIVFKLLIVEEKLFARCENKLRSTIRAFECSIYEFHTLLPLAGIPLRSL